MNPFQLIGQVGKNIRKLSKTIKEQFPNLKSYAVVCESCRRHSHELYVNWHENDVTLTGHTRSRKSVVGNNRNLHENRNCVRMLDARASNSRNENQFKGGIQNEEVEDSEVFPQNISSVGDNDDLKIIFENLKASFSSLREHDPLRVRLLTIAPQSWTLQRTAEEFGTTMYYVRKARELLANEGLFAEVPVTIRRRLPESCIEEIINFYNSR